MDESNKVLCFRAEVKKGIMSERKAARDGECSIRHDSWSDVLQDSECDKVLDVLAGVVKLTLCEVAGYKPGDDFALLTCEFLENALYSGAFSKALNLFADEMMEAECSVIDYPGGKEKHANAKVIPVVICEAGETEAGQVFLRACQGKGAGYAGYGCGVARFHGVNEFDECIHGVRDGITAMTA